MSFWNNFVEACAMNGVRPTPTVKKLGLSTGNIHRWQSGGTVSSDAVVTIAKHLGCSTDFLLTGKNRSDFDTTVARTEDEIRILREFRALDPAFQGRLISYIDGLKEIENQKKEKEKSASSATGEGIA